MKKEMFFIKVGMIKNYKLIIKFSIESLKENLESFEMIKP